VTGEEDPFLVIKRDGEREILILGNERKVP